MDRYTVERETYPPPLIPRHVNGEAYYKQPGYEFNREPDALACWAVMDTHAKPRRAKARWLLRCDAETICTALNNFSLQTRAA